MVTHRFCLALLFLVFIVTGCAPTPESADQEIDYLEAVPSDAVSSEQGALIVDSTIPELQSAMEQGTLTSEEITAFYLDQIAAKNDVLNAVIAVNPGALDAARALDEERAGGTSRGRYTASRFY